MELEGQLSSRDVEKRREAVLMLSRGEGEAESDEKTRLLLRAMRDPSWRVRKTAVDILLGQYPVESYVEGLIRLLYLEDNADARNTAIESLTRLGRQVSGHLVEAFEHAGPDVRKFLIDIIGETRDPRCVPLLVFALSDEDGNVRASAAEHLGAMREPGAVDALIGVVRSGDLWTAYAAADALGAIGDARAVPALVEALEKRTLRKPALRALGRLSALSAVEHIVRFVDHRSPSVRVEALKALEVMYQNGVLEDTIVGAFQKVFGQRAVEVLLAQARTGKSSGREAAILFLGLMRDEAALEPLLELAADEFYVEEVKRTLAFLGREKPEVLVPLFERESTFLRRLICEVAGDVASPVFIDAMVGLLGDADGHTRSMAARALANIGDPGAAKHVLKLLTDEYADVQEAAVKALGKLREGLEMSEICSMLEDGNPVVRRNAALLLGETGSPGFVHDLCFAQKDEEASVRRAVISALAAIGSPESVHCLVRALPDEDPEIRAAAALSLGSAGASEAVEPLCMLLRDSDDMVKAAAARALGTIASEDAVPHLVGLLSDPNGFVVTAVITALGRIGGAGAKKAILGMLDSGEDEVRRTAISSLAGFDGVQRSLMPFLRNQDWASRVAAIEALGISGDAWIVKELGEIYEHEGDPTVKKAIKRFLDD
ncbi:MAG: HEAT repeat domain-containing protein [Nitrospirota bacterium]